MQQYLSYLLLFFIFLILNSYLIYPIVIYLISLFFLGKKKEQSMDEYPPISIIISAYNEEKVIENRIRNIISSHYPLNNIEILVGSDCSSDKTNEILRQLITEIPQLRVFLFSERRGKAGVLNEIVDYAKSEILVFTDANTEFQKDALKNLVHNFSDNRIGGVSGKLELVETLSHLQKGVEERKYWQYETFIKKSEGNLGILIGANGGIFAIKKSLFTKIPLDKPVTDDFFISLSVVKKGFRLVFDETAIAYEEVAKDVKTEFRRKIRFAATNFQTITFFKELLFNKNFLLSYAFWSHKIIRWYLPLILIALMIVNVLLVGYNPIFDALLYLQIVVYLLGILGYLLLQIGIRIGLISLISYFLLTNLALLIGLIKFLSKKHSLIWQSTPR